MWNPGLTVSYNAVSEASVRKALTSDTLDATMNGFANLLGCQGTHCANEPGDSDNYVYTNYISGQANYKIYFHTGDCHAEREQDGNGESACDYDNMTQSGVKFQSWVLGWLGFSGHAYINVQ
jgi:hypothetical protein